MLTDRQVYGDLIDIIKNKEHFVLTSNVDGMFERNSLDPSKVYTVQGDMQYIQCLKPCSKQVRSIYPHFSLTKCLTGVAYAPVHTEDASSRRQSDSGAQES